MVVEGDPGPDPVAEEPDDKDCGAGRSSSWNLACRGSASFLFVPNMVFASSFSEAGFELSDAAYSEPKSGPACAAAMFEVCNQGTKSSRAVAYLLTLT